MTNVSAEPTPRVKRPWRERKSSGLIRRPDRLVGIDMRTRIGREYAQAFLVAFREFPGAPADRVGEVARLRVLASLAQQAALVGSGSTDAALRATAAADRCAKDLGTKP